MSAHFNVFLWRVEVSLVTSDLKNVGVHTSLATYTSAVGSGWPGVRLSIFKKRRGTIITISCCQVLRGSYPIVDDKKVLRKMSFTGATREGEYYMICSGVIISLSRLCRFFWCIFWYANSNNEDKMVIGQFMFVGDHASKVILQVPAKCVFII